MANRIWKEVDGWATGKPFRSVGLTKSFFRCHFHWTHSNLRRSNPLDPAFILRFTTSYPNFHIYSPPCPRKAPQKPLPLCLIPSTSTFLLSSNVPLLSFPSCVLHLLYATTSRPASASRPTTTPQIGRGSSPDEPSAWAASPPQDPAFIRRVSDICIKQSFDKQGVCPSPASWPTAADCPYRRQFLRSDASCHEARESSCFRFTEVCEHVAIMRYALGFLLG